jgi:hypothetical protein
MFNFQLFIFSDLFTYPSITKISPSTTSLAAGWLAPKTDKFTGSISKYELCYSGDFNTTGCIDIGAASTQWNVTELHPHVEYELKIRSAALLGYGPFSPVKYATTLESGEERGLFISYLVIVHWLHSLLGIRGLILSMWIIYAVV